jgi:hypothetical protein
VEQIIVFVCCAGSFILAGLVAGAFSVYTLITGQSLQWRLGLRGSRTANPTVNRISAIVGVITGLLLMCIGVALVLFLLMGGGKLQ